MTSKTFTRDSYYEYTDLDRIEVNIDELNTYIATYINDTITAYSKYSVIRDNEWIPSEAEWEHIEDGMNDLAKYSGYPTGFSVILNYTAPFNWGYTDANRWEINLDLIDIQNDALKTCGNFSCSEGDMIYGVR